MNIMNGIYQTLCILSNRTLTLWKRCRKIPIQACSLFIPPFSSLSESSAMSTNCQHTMQCTLLLMHVLLRFLRSFTLTWSVFLSAIQPLHSGDKRCISGAGNRKSVHVIVLQQCDQARFYVLRSLYSGKLQTLHRAASRTA